MPYSSYATITVGNLIKVDAVSINYGGKDENINIGVGDCGGDDDGGDNDDGVCGSFGDTLRRGLWGRYLIWNIVYCSRWYSPLQLI